MMDRVNEFDGLPEPMQRDLDQRVIDAGGDIASVRREVEATLAKVNEGHVETEPRGSQADRVLLMVALRYLDAKARAGLPTQATRGGWLNGLGVSLKQRLSGRPMKNGGK